MPVYNSEKYITESVGSILRQTWADFELLIIDDASSDNTVSIIEQIKDDRIRLIKKKLNTGYTNSLNMALKLSKGRYIARMDGDDISLPGRFKKQVECLEENSEIAVCGTWYQLLGTMEILKHPTGSEDIKLALLECCSLGHPTVMLRKSVLDHFNLEYDVNREPAEDYDLWVKIIKHKKIINIPEVLLQYRLHENQVSGVREIQQQAMAQKARIKLIGYLYDDLPVIDITEPITFDNNVKRNKDKLILFTKEIQKVKSLNLEKKFFSIPGFHHFLETKRRMAIRSFFDHPLTSGWKYLYLFLFSKNQFYRNFKNSDKLRLIAKNIFLLATPTICFGRY